MVRVVYNTSTKIIVTVLDAGDGTTVHPTSCSTLEDTEANILDSAEEAGIEDLQPIIEYLASI